MTATDVQSAADAVWTLLSGIANVNAFDGDFVDEDGNRVRPPADDDGRVHAYAVYYPSPGRSHSRRHGAARSNLDWSFQVTCAGGDRTRALWCVTQVRNALAGARVGGNRITEGFDPGPLRRDDDVKPPRFYLPLQFSLRLT